MSEQRETDSHRDFTGLVEVLNQYAKDRRGMSFAIFVFTFLALFFFTLI